MKEEVLEALKQILPLKSSCPYGFRDSFFQKHWHLFGDVVSATVINFLHGGGMILSLNSTFIALIPKKYNSKLISHFRPINLCNAIYKLVSKVIVNRLKPYMDQIISSSQIPFIPGRIITDNIIIAHELLQTIKHKMKGKKRKMAVKLDMSKAYGKVEWSYLMATMRALGFQV